MKPLNLFIAFSLLVCFSRAEAQNHEGRVNQFYFQEAPGKYCIAKLGPVINCNTKMDTSHRFSLSACDITWLVQLNGDRVWRPRSVSLKYLGTDPEGNTWLTKVQQREVRTNSSSRYSYTITSQKTDGSGKNPDFQILDWTGKKWNVEIRGREDPTIVLTQISN